MQALLSLSIVLLLIHTGYALNIGILRNVNANKPTLYVRNIGAPFKMFVLTDKEQATKSEDHWGEPVCKGGFQTNVLGDDGFDLEELATKCEVPPSAEKGAILLKFCGGPRQSNNFIFFMGKEGLSHVTKTIKINDKVQHPIVTMQSVMRSVLLLIPSENAQHIAMMENYDPFLAKLPVTDLEKKLQKDPKNESLQKELTDALATVAQEESALEGATLLHFVASHAPFNGDYGGYATDGRNGC